MSDAPENTKSCAASASNREKLLLQVETTLSDVLLDKTSRPETRSWLLTTLSRLSGPATKTSAERLVEAACLSGSAERTGNTACAQLLHLLCELQPQKVVELIAEDKQALPAFFGGNEERILTWFANFGAKPNGGHDLGAIGLGQYIMSQRKELWDALVWKGQHGHAPSSVVARPQMLADLDVVPTVKALERRCPALFNEPELLRICSLLPSVDYAWFCQELQSILQGYPTRSRARHLYRLICSALEGQPLSLVTHRVMPLLADTQLADCAANLEPGRDGTGHSRADESSSGSMDALLQGVIFSDAIWRGKAKIDDLLMLHACALCFHKINRAIRHSQHAQALQDIQGQLLQLQALEPSTANLMLVSARQHSRHRALHLLLLEAFMMQHAAAACLDGSTDLHILNDVLAAHEMHLELVKGPDAAMVEKHAKHKHKRKRRSFDWLEEDDLVTERSTAEHYKLYCKGSELHEGPGSFVIDAVRSQMMQTWMRKLFKLHQ